MLFVHYTLIIANVFVIDTDSYVINHEEGTIADSKISNSVIHQINNTGVKSNFQLKQTNVSNNLKSNFFDKMLSNEMLSIKQHIYEKDSSYGSTVYLTFRNNAQTPTLEIKQKWLLEKPIVKHTRKKQENFTSFPFGKNKVKPRQKGFEHEKRNLADIQSEAMDEGDFSPILITTHDHPKTTHANHYSYTKSCAPTTCSRHKSEKLLNTVKICSHTTRADCTRSFEIKPISITYYPYYVYSPYFVGVTNDYIYNTYEKHTRKPKKPYNYDLYLEGGDELSSDENDYKINAVSGKYDEKNYKKEPKIYSIKYDDPDDTEDAIDLTKKLSKSYLKIVNRDEFVSEVVEDLKDYYDDVVIKDCYCSCFKKSRSTILHFMLAGFCIAALCFVNYI